MTILKQSQCFTWEESIYSMQKFVYDIGSGCGAVDRVVASDTRGPKFESTYRQLTVIPLTKMKQT